MIVRKQSIKQSSEEVSMMVSYGLPDVKKAMRNYYQMFAQTCGKTYALNTPHNELDLLHYFENYMFKDFVQKYREQLAAWAFAMALRHKYILSSVDEDEAKKLYYLSEETSKTSGRPKENIDD